jgi:hypothetical protein
MTKTVIRTFLSLWLALVGTLLPGLIAWAVTAASLGLWPMAVLVLAILGSAALAFWRIAEDGNNKALAFWRIAEDANNEA